MNIHEHQAKEILKEYGFYLQRNSNSFNKRN